MISYTITEGSFKRALLSIFKLQKARALRYKTIGRYFDVAHANRDSVAWPPLKQSPCTDRPPLAFAPVTRRGISLPRLYKAFVFPLSVHGCSDMPPVITNVEATEGVMI